MKDDSLSTSTLLRDISSLGWALSPLLEKGKDYNSLLSYIIQQNWFFNDNEDTHLPSIKELVKDTGIPYTKIKKFLNQIFEDFQQDWSLCPSFTETEYQFSIKSWEKTMYFRVKSLPVIPRVGEHIRIPYFSAYLKFEHFHVSKITHEFENGKIIIKIHCKEGDYNLFWHYRLDEAVEKREIGLYDLWHKLDYQLKKDLGVIRS